MNASAHRRPIFIIVEGSRVKGMGHLVRMRLLAARLSGCGETLYCFTESAASRNFLDDPNWRTQQWPVGERETWLAWQIRSLRPALLIIDRLDLTIRELEKLQASESFATVLFEVKEPELIRRADLVVNGIYGAAGLQPSPAANILRGTAYLILDQGLVPARRAYRFRLRCRKLLVSLGGSDPNELIFPVMRALRGLQQLVCLPPVMVILGTAFNQPERVREQAKQIGGISVMTAVPSLAPHFADADLAVVSGGMTLFEACCVGVPCLVLPQVDHQEQTGAALAHTGSCMMLPLLEAGRPERIAGALRLLLENNHRRLQIHQAARRVTDGSGLDRVTACIRHVLDHSGR